MTEFFESSIGGWEEIDLGLVIFLDWRTIREIRLEKVRSSDLEVPHILPLEQTQGLL